MARRRTVTEKQIQAPHWDAHEVVMIRSLRERDTEAIQNELTEMATGANTNMKLALGTTRLLTILHGVSSWTFTNDLGNPLPFSKDAVLDLAPEDAEFIYNAINELNQPMSDEEKKDSLTTGKSGSLENTPAHLKLL